MSEEFLPFAKPDISEAGINEVVDSLRSGWLTTGPKLQKFEQALREYCDTPHALCLSSATAGLHLALLSLGLEPGDEVITTPLTFIATANTIVHAGAKPVFADVDPATYLLDVEQVASKITDRTRAIVPVHFGGAPVDLDPLYALAEKHNLRIIEDAAHAIGTYYKDKIIGSFGDIQVFSFHPNKNITTGEGGCVTTRDDETAAKIKNLRFHGIDREAWNRFSKEGSQCYLVTAPGFKYNMMDIQAALGLHQLPRLNGFIEKRRELAEKYQAEFANWEQWQRPQPPSYAHKHAWHFYNPLLNLEEVSITRDQFINQMKDYNIGVGLHYQAIHTHPYLQQQFGYKDGDFPIAEDIANRIVSLPLFPTMTDSDQARVFDAMRNIFTA